jgi:hypothetical protein
MVQMEGRGEEGRKRDDNEVSLRRRSDRAGHVFDYIIGPNIPSWLTEIAPNGWKVLSEHNFQKRKEVLITLDWCPF